MGCVPEELDSGEAGVAIEYGGEGEAVEEGARAEHDLVLHLVAGALQLGAAPPDDLNLRRRGPRGRHAARRRSLAPHATAAAPDPDRGGGSAGGGEGGGRQPRHARAQQSHFRFDRARRWSSVGDKRRAAPHTNFCVCGGGCTVGLPRHVVRC